MNMPCCSFGNPISIGLKFLWLCWMLLVGCSRNIPSTMLLFVLIAWVITTCYAIFHAVYVFQLMMSFQWNMYALLFETLWTCPENPHDWYWFMFSLWLLWITWILLLPCWLPCLSNFGWGCMLMMNLYWWAWWTCAAILKLYCCSYQT